MIVSSSIDIRGTYSFIFRRYLTSVSLVYISTVGKVTTTTVTTIKKKGRRNFYGQKLSAVSSASALHALNIIVLPLCISLLGATSVLRGGRCIVRIVPQEFNLCLLRIIYFDTAVLSTARFGHTHRSGISRNVSFRSLLYVQT